jgi:hypothetical protein
MRKEITTFIESVARPTINNGHAARVAVLNTAIAALKIALAQYESELARLGTDA